MKRQIFGMIFSLFIGSMVVNYSSVFAASYDIKEMTPEVKSALDGRKSRFDELKSLKQQGAVGENNRGYVEVLGGSGAAGSIVDAENKDRRTIYKAIAEQNNLPGDALATIEAVFAGVQRDKASSGDKIQNSGGQWITK